MTIFFISDTHFSHEKFLTFQNEGGHPIRVFENAEHMDETRSNDRVEQGGQGLSIIYGSVRAYNLGSGRRKDIRFTFQGLKHEI